MHFHFCFKDGAPEDCKPSTFTVDGNDLAVLNVSIAPYTMLKPLCCVPPSKSSNAQGSFPILG